MWLFRENGGAIDISEAAALNIEEKDKNFVVVAYLKKTFDSWELKSFKSRQDAKNFVEYVVDRLENEQH